MNQRVWLNLMAIPTLVGSLLSLSFMTGIAFATESAISSEPASCDIPVDADLQSGVMRSLSHQSNSLLLASAIDPLLETPNLDFTAAESDAAVTLFGCDCPSCIGALRQLQRSSLLENSQGHCWTSLQQRVSPSEVEAILESLENEAGNQPL